MCTKGKNVANLFTKVVATTKCFDQNLRKVKVISCGNGCMITEFQVGEEHLNPRGTLHGGFLAHLVDAISTYALMTNENIDTRGMSIDLSVSYMNAAREGDCIQVEAVTKKTGKKIAFLEVEVKNSSTNQILATVLQENSMWCCQQCQNNLWFGIAGNTTCYKLGFGTKQLKFVIGNP